jgi:fucose permease
VSGYSRGVIWFNRCVLAAATFVMTMIALRTLRDPIGATAPLNIALNSPSAVTIVRVGFGGFPLGFAMALAACLISTRRLLTGLLLMLAVVGGATIARVQGLVLDGATPYNLTLLRPEVAMVTLSLVGIALELRRLRGSGRHRHRAAGLEPSTP